MPSHASPLDDISQELAQAHQQALDEALLVATVPDYGQFEEVERPARTAMIATLVKEGANPNAVSVKNGNTPLSHAILRADGEMIEQLLDLGASWNPPNDHPRSTPPLHLAAWQGDVAILQRLLDLGAPLDQRDQAGNTSLFTACMNDQHAAIGFLAGQGVPLDARNHAGRTALDTLALRVPVYHGDPWRCTIDVLLALYAPHEQSAALRATLALLDDPARPLGNREDEREIYRTRNYLLDLLEKLDA